MEGHRVGERNVVNSRKIGSKNVTTFSQSERVLETTLTGGAARHDRTVLAAALAPARQPRRLEQSRCSRSSGVGDHNQEINFDAGKRARHVADDVLQMSRPVCRRHRCLLKRQIFSRKTIT